MLGFLDGIVLVLFVFGGFLLFFFVVVCVGFFKKHEHNAFSQALPFFQMLLTFIVLVGFVNDC